MLVSLLIGGLIGAMVLGSVMHWLARRFGWDVERMTIMGLVVGVLAGWLIGGLAMALTIWGMGGFSEKGERTA